MLNNLIDKIKEENVILEDKIKKIEISNKINSIIVKILNNEAITEEEYEIFKSIKSRVNDLSDLEQETLLFIECVIEGEYLLENIQIDLLKKLLKVFKVTDISKEKKQYEDNNRLIESLLSKDIFSEFDLLNNKLNKYGYSKKDILEIIKGLILCNYGSISKDKVGCSDTIVEKVEQEDTKYKERRNKIITILRKYDFHTKDFEDEEFEKLFNSSTTTENIIYVLKFIKSLRIKPMSIYKNSNIDFINLLIYSTKEIIDEYVKICEEIGVKPVQLIKISPVVITNYRVPSSEDDIENIGFFDRFKENIEFFKSIGYVFERCFHPIVYLLNPRYCKAAYHLFTNEYNFVLNDPNDVELITTRFFGNTMDRTIELAHGAEIINSDIRSIVSFSKKLSYFAKKTEVLNSRNELSLADMAMLATMAIGGDANEFVDEVAEIPDLVDPERIDELYELFEHDIDQEGETYYMIPPYQLINKEVYNNEYVAYLEETYRKGSRIYVVNGTRISKVKVLRILSYFMDIGVDINEASVKFAMKFDLIAFQEDIDNINKAFANFTMGGAKKYE